MGKTNSFKSLSGDEAFMEVELRVDGEEVPLNEFVQKMLGSLIKSGVKPR